MLVTLVGMFGILFAEHYSLTPVISGLYTPTDPSVFIFRDESDEERAQLHQRLLRAADVTNFQVVARDHAAGPYKYRGGFKRVVPFVCEGKGKGLLLARQEAFDIFQASLSHIQSWSCCIDTLLTICCLRCCRWARP